jgi:hypothetical protein
MEGCSAKRAAEIVGVVGAQLQMKERHPRSEIGLTEALQVCYALGVRKGVYAQWMAECLGLTWKESVAEPGRKQPDTSAGTPASTERSAPETPVATETKKLKLLDPVAKEPMAFEEAFEGQAERIRNAVEIRPASFAASTERPDFQPLFLDRWFQGIFTAVLGVKVLSSEIDFRKLERYVIQEEFFTQLPFKTRTKLIKGVYVLLDRSESMQPFWRDQAELIERLHRMLGVALVQFSWFEYDANSRRIIWRNPRQFRIETPVLLVTDFGRGKAPDGAQSMDWEPWQRLILEPAQSSRSPVFALIPAAKNYWPPTVDRFIDCALLWDRETSPLAAARQCRK